jgi:hypothetical protein
MAKARDLYSKSARFRYTLEYSESLHPDKIFILSAKYFLLDLEREVEPYDKTLNKMKTEEVKEWAGVVIAQLRKATDLKNDEFIFFAGKKYQKYLVPQIVKYKYPLEGMNRGEQMRWLKERIGNERKL